MEAARATCLDGERCRKLREARGLSRQSLANLSRGPDALSVPTLKRAEAGQAILFSSAESLARLLDVPVTELLASGPANAPGDGGMRQASIAVLPFETTDDPDARVFADGLVEDLISRLATYWFPVIARSSSFSLRDKTLQSREVGQRLGAEYLVEGTVRRSSTKIRVTARLVGAATGHQLWGDVYDAVHADLFESQDHFCRLIVSQVGHQVLAKESERARQRARVDHDAWQLALRGAWHFHRSTAEDNVKARELMQRALGTDPNITLARYLTVLSHQHDLLNQWAADAAATRREMLTHAREFERIAPDNPWMHVAVAYSCVAHGAGSEAMDHLQEALRLDPNSVPAHSLYGQTLAMTAQPDQGLHELGLARTLSPRDSGLWAMLLTTGLAHFAAGRYEECVTWLNNALTQRPQIPMIYAALASAHAHLGDFPRAQSALVRMRQQDADMRRNRFDAVLGVTDREIAGRFLGGLRLAGMPES
ncbi:MAG TPA: hypothetical protein VMI54_22345 [Polyangiaceae bacterium]|nr:hypothetical protein [Polyangiaceae bacterium]